jgi:lipoyl-dependent peroxiredoxin
MSTRNASAVWSGDLKGGKGKMKLGSGAFEGQYSFSSRFEEGKGTNPEELIGAAHAGCFSMAFSHGLSEAGFVPTQVATTAKVHLAMADGGFKIITIELECEADVPKIDDKTFQKLAEEAKTGCPVSKALAGVDIKLKAKLLN